MYSPGQWLDPLSLVRTSHERPRLVWTGMVGRRQNQAPHAGVGGTSDTCVSSRPPCRSPSMSPSSAGVSALAADPRARGIATSVRGVA